MNSSNVLNKARFSLIMTLVAAFLSSISIFLISFVPGFQEEGKHLISYIVAAAFWIGILLLIISTCRTERILRKDYKKMIAKGDINKGQSIGVINFNKEWKRIILYFVILVGMLLIISDIIVGCVPGYIMFPILSVTFFALIVHSVIDGKSYKVYKIMKENTKK